MNNIELMNLDVEIKDGIAYIFDTETKKVIPTRGLVEVKIDKEKGFPTVKAEICLMGNLEDIS